MSNIKSQMTDLEENAIILNEIYNTNLNNINLISHIKDIEEMITTLNDKIENLNINYKNAGLSTNAISRINNNIIAKETIKPFVPLMMYYNILLQEKENNIKH